MKTWYGNNGNYHYIMCDTPVREIYSFTKFGSLQGTGGSIRSCYKWSEVDVLSIVGTSSRTCEVFFDGYTTEIQGNLLEVIKGIREKGKYVGTMFSIKHEDDIGSFTQVLFVYMKGVLTSEEVRKEFNTSAWVGVI